MIRIDKVRVRWPPRVVKKEKGKTVVTLMLPPCITGDDFKIENRRSQLREKMHCLALEICGFCGTFLGRCLGSSSGCSGRTQKSIWDMVLVVINI